MSGNHDDASARVGGHGWLGGFTCRVLNIDALINAKRERPIGSRIASRLRRTGGDTLQPQKRQSAEKMEQRHREYEHESGLSLVKRTNRSPARWL